MQKARLSLKFLADRQAYFCVEVLAPPAHIEDKANFAMATSKIVYNCNINYAAIIITWNRIMCSSRTLDIVMIITKILKREAFHCYDKVINVASLYNPFLCSPFNPMQRYASCIGNFAVEENGNTKKSLKE